MKFFSTDPHGTTIVEPTADQRRMVLQSVLDEADQADFPEAYLSGANGIVIGYRCDGCLLWEESGTITRYLPGVDVDGAMSAWNLLVERNWNQLDSMDWKSIQ